MEVWVGKGFFYTSIFIFYSLFELCGSKFGSMPVVEKQYLLGFLVGKLCATYLGF